MSKIPKLAAEARAEGRPPRPNRLVLTQERQARKMASAPVSQVRASRVRATGYPWVAPRDAAHRAELTKAATDAQEALNQDKVTRLERLARAERARG